jgi:hypothetical protein
MAESRPEDVSLPDRVLRCTLCNEAVDVCKICRTGFLVEHVILCRPDGSHDHAACATGRTRRPPPITTPLAPSTVPPVSKTRPRSK